MPRKTTKKRTKKRNNIFAFKGQGISTGGQAEFFDRFEKLADIAGCKDACKLLNKSNRMLMYLLRIHLTQPRVDKGEPIDKKQAKVLAILFRSLREKRDIELIKGREKISIGDVYVIDCFIYFIRKEDSGLDLEAFNSAFKPLIDAYDELESPEDLLYGMYDNILAMLNVIGREMFSIKTEFVQKKHPVSGVFHIVKVKHHRPVKRSIAIEGKRRPIIQFGWPIANGGIWYFKIRSDEIKAIYKGEKKELEVYIQSHAIMRFEERTKPLSLLACRLFMANVFRNFKVVHVKDGKIFLPLYYGHVKIGYFVAAIIDEKVIIKTFLFITHRSTPEGHLLEKVSGLGKKDISYWRFDSVSSFLSNPPKEDSLIKKIMQEAGIHQLFDLKNVIALNSNQKDVDWAEVEEYIENGREERLQIPEEKYDEEYC
ncbi:MAG: hypothetical protein JXR82_04015 [Marinifilaceae bacterium]|nr:hypothetical protein [Marinifilaceae bacterium]